MYRLLIVDDEEIITDSLHEVLSLRFENQLEIYKAYSAKEALNWLNNTRIDIILTDIKMPGMSGIDLMQEIVKMWPKSRIVFLTGHSEFEYAYTAIQQSNVKFILKTEPYNVVIKMIENNIHDIDKENELSEIIQYSVEQNNKINILEQENIIKSLLFEQISAISLHELQQKFNTYKIPLQANKPVMLISCKFFLNEKQHHDENTSIEPLIAYWNMYMGNQFTFTFIKSASNEFIWLVQMKDELGFNASSQISKIIEGNLELVQYKLIEKYSLNVSFTIAEHGVNWDALYFTLNRLRDLQRLVLNENIPLLQIDYEHLHQLDIQADQLKLMNRVQQYSIWLELGKHTEIKSLFDDLLHMKLSKQLTIPLVTEIYFTIALALLGYANKAKLNDKLFDLNTLMRLDAHVSSKAAFKYLLDTTEIIIEQMHTDERTRASVLMEKICEYIDSHLSEDLTLVKLAEVHYFNPSYLSRLFKQEQGINLSEYIDQRRIHLAKQLLADSEQKIRDISLLVGYEAAHSFSRFFKKATGFTPQEYRDSIIFNMK